MAYLYYLGLGSNLGKRQENLDQAVALLGEKAGTIEALSSYMESEPWGFDSDHLFTNAVVAVCSSLEPMQMLDLTQQIECQLGRRHKHGPGEPYQDRIIDIDLLEYDGAPISNSRLVLPHPLIEVRDFVKIPLEECKSIIENRK